MEGEKAQSEKKEDSVDSPQGSFSPWPNPRRALLSVLRALRVTFYPDARHHHHMRLILLRGLGLVYLIAFASYWAQAEGLIGDNGILPASQFFARVDQRFGAEAFWRLPSIFWLWPSSTFLHILCGAGCFISIALMANRPPNRLWCILLWVLYLSLLSPGQTFYRFQWDLLLLEMGFLAIFLSVGAQPQRSSAGRPPSPLSMVRVYVANVFHARGPPAPPSPLSILLVRLLLFRLIFSSGIGKWLRGGETWRSGHALDFHFWTQPLPNQIAYYVHHLPESFLHFSVYAMFFLQIIVPFFFFGPRRLRIISFFLVIGLQFLIAVSGNFAFFNLLTVVISLCLLDDTFLNRIAPKYFPAPTSDKFEGTKTGVLPRITKPLSTFVLVLLLMLHTLQIRDAIQFSGLRIELFEIAAQKLRPLYLVNRYGLFIRMTTHRREIIIEGSDDNQEWKSYNFRYKPGSLDGGLHIVAPHQPRLDWQMWFAALGDIRRNRWVTELMRKLLDGSEPVLELLADNPFPDDPPSFIRAISYEYEFTSMAERSQTGKIWKKKNPKPYAPTVSR